MPASPAMRFSPGREPRTDNHKRGRSLESGIVFKERDDDLALFNEVQSKERDDFLLQSNDDFEDIFVTKLRHFSDHKIGINVASHGESSDLLNTEEEKNDYEWLLTPPDTPLFPSLDDEAPQVTHAQRGRPRTQPISISRSSTMEKSHRSSRGSASPNRLSPSPRSRNTTFQPRGRVSSTPSSSPPPNRRPTNGSRRPSSPSSNSSTAAPRASTPTSRRLSMDSAITTSPGARGISPVNKISRGNSVSPKVKAWQANIPGFSTEAPPNLRTSLSDRPASYVRGSSPASKNGRQSKSPTASRSISSSHSHDRDRFSSHSKGSIASSADDDVEFLPSVTVDGSDRSNSRKVSGFRNNKAPLSQKPIRTASSSSAPKRSFDLALRQMDNKRGPQNMFRPLLSSVPSSTLYAGKASPAWNSSVTTSSNASSDIGTSGTHDIDETELNQDDATSGYRKVPGCDVGDEVFIFEKANSLNEDMGNETHDSSPVVQIDGSKEVLTLHSQVDGFEKLAEHDAATSIVSDDLKDMLLCSRCGCRYLVISPTEEDIKLCPKCQKLTINDTVTTEVAMRISQAGPIMSDEDLESLNTSKPQMTLVESESPEMPSKIEAQPEKHEDLVMDGESIHTEPILNVMNQSSVSYSDTGSEQNQQVIDILKSKVDPFKGEGISIVLNRSSSIKGPVIRSGTFSASSISFDDFSYVRDSTNSMRSSVGRGSVSASSSIDFGPAMQSDTRFQRQSSSKKSDIEHYKYEMNVKHRRSASSFSGTSSHAFHPASVGTSTLDSFEVAIRCRGTDVDEVTSVGPAETRFESENSTCTENEGVNKVQVGIATSVGPQETPFENENSTCTENEDVNKVQVGIATTSELPTSSQTAPDSGEVVVLESSDFENPVSVQNVEDVGKDIASIICTVEEDTSQDSFVKGTEVAEVLLGDISGEVDHTCSLSPASECNFSPHSESSIEELQDLPVPTALDKDITASSADCDTSNHPSSIVEESMLLVETKGRSLTLEEATETILFCSSIVHSLAYEAASIAIEKETPPDPSDTKPLVPAAGKGYSGRKELQSRKTSRRSSKAQKARQRKATEKDTTKASNGTNTSEETELPKPRIVFPNNKENTKPPKVLESKCNCRIM